MGAGFAEGGLPSGESGTAAVWEGLSPAGAAGAAVCSGAAGAGAGAACSGADGAADSPVLASCRAETRLDRAASCTAESSAGIAPGLLAIWLQNKDGAHSREGALPGASAVDGLAVTDYECGLLTL